MIDLWPSAAITGVGNESQLRRLKPALAKVAAEQLGQLEAAAAGVSAEAPCMAVKLDNVRAVVTAHGAARRSPDLRVEVHVTANGRTMQVRAKCTTELRSRTRYSFWLHVHGYATPARQVLRFLPAGDALPPTENANARPPAANALLDCAALTPSVAGT